MTFTTVRVVTHAKFVRNIRSRYTLPQLWQQLNSNYYFTLNNRPHTRTILSCRGPLYYECRIYLFIRKFGRTVFHFHCLARRHRSIGDRTTIVIMMILFK